MIKRFIETEFEFVSPYDGSRAVLVLSSSMGAVIHLHKASFPCPEFYPFNSWDTALAWLRQRGYFDDSEVTR